MSIAIISDSACDLSLDYLHKINVECLPLGVTIGDKEYEDGKTITPGKVYHLMRDGEAPKTSQVSAEAFRRAFTAHVEKDEPFIYFALSSELSGTYQTAKMIEQEIKEEHPDAQFEIIDTKAVSLGYGLIVMRAAELAQEGRSFNEIIEIGNYYSKHMEHIFTVDDLEYLYRGGRVSKTSAFVGSLLKIKPLLHVEEGRLVPLEKIRGSKKVLKRMVEVMKERGSSLDQQRIAISHGDDQETAEKLAELIKEECGTTDIHIDMVGAVIGAHAGPGTMALFFLNNQPK
ncbi:DegV family protein [Halobacillus sp. A5]|uniref:DegV family protein n=1 Tax=Halobacillus sp. A5 TaxID=2880263 RepID=UPI0020A68EA5|nr:DegV family protein [Halobacillus sp. A5]MCP3026708.1 DegV family protein [Halobacillus sp. A5]